MTDSEFDEWITGYLAAFPDFRTWLSGIPVDSKREMIRLWREALADIEFRDAKAVTARIVAGDDEAIPAYERELTAAHIRRLAKDNNRRRAERSAKKPDEVVARRRFTRGPSSRESLRKMVDILDAHPELIASDISGDILPQDGDGDGRRYDCCLCLDHGLVIVWSHVSVKAAILGRLGEANYRRTMAAPCNCRRGQAKVNTSENIPRHWVGWRSMELLYSEKRYCICPHSDTERKENIDALKEWAAVRLLEWQKSKRHSEFDQFNQHGAGA